LQRNIVTFGELFLKPSDTIRPESTRQYFRYTVYILYFVVKLQWNCDWDGAPGRVTGALRLRRIPRPPNWHFKHCWSMCSWPLKSIID